MTAMNRRKFITTIGAGLAGTAIVGTASGKEEESKSSEPNDNSDDTRPIIAFGEHFRGVYALRMTDETAVIGLEATDNDVSGTNELIYTVADRFAKFVKRGWEPEALHIAVTNERDLNAETYLPTVIVRFYINGLFNSRQYRAWIDVFTTYDN